MENNKILRKRRIVEDVEGMENVSFIIRRIRGTTRSTVYKIRNTLCSRVYECAHLETRIDAHAYVYDAVIIRFRCVKGDVVKMGSRTNGFVYNTTLFPYETSSPVFLVRRFFVLAFDLASSFFVEFRLRILDGIGWNGSGVTVSASGNDLKERRTLLSMRNRMPPRLLFDIQLNGEASVFTRESCELNVRYHRYVEASEEGRRGYHNTRRGQFPSFVRNIYFS